MLNADGRKLKHNICKSQQKFLLSFCYLVREGKDFFNHCKVVKKVLSFFVQKEIKLIFIFLFLSIFIDLFLIYGSALFLLASREAVGAAAAIISFSLAISSIG